MATGLKPLPKVSVPHPAGTSASLGGKGEPRIVARKPKTASFGAESQKLRRSIFDTKFEDVMGDFKAGKLKDRQGAIVTSEDHAHLLAEAAGVQAVQDHRKANGGLTPPAPPTAVGAKLAAQEEN